MKNWFLLIAFIFFMTSSSAFAVPDNIQVGKPTFTVYDASYNIALRNKLEANYDKKYPATLSHDKDGYPVYSHNYPLGSYSREVLLPYDLNKKTDNYKIIRKH